MRVSMGLALMLTGFTAAAGGVWAAPSIEIDHAVARVTVIPEARSDVAVSVIKANPRLPLKITRIGDQVVIDGGLGWRSPNCHGRSGHPSAGVWGLGEVRYEDMPQVVVRTPRNAKVGAGGAVYGAVGRGDGLELSSSGCGDWTVADQTGPLRLHVAGSGDVRAGSAGSADVGISGSGDVVMGSARAGLTTSIAGSGDVTAAAVDGPLHARVAGSGDVRVHGGAVTDMHVSVAGAGDVNFGGVAQTLDVSVAGSGDVTVARVVGAVTKHVVGSGDVRVGR